MYRMLYHIIRTSPSSDTLLVLRHIFDVTLIFTRPGTTVQMQKGNIYQGKIDCLWGAGRALLIEGTEQKEEERAIEPRLMMFESPAPWPSTAEFRSSPVPPTLSKVSTSGRTLPQHHHHHHHHHHHQAAHMSKVS
uniref:POU domain, class 4, transcription factor 2-like n=1 Tax=Doryrhamphus excisus TaxID=161450 RepID=UPI0025AE98FF|nr:POU domain, class 4, transcription factor 2-like [Doryrhamphus excisus]